MKRMIAAVVLTFLVAQFAKADLVFEFGQLDMAGTAVESNVNVVRGQQASVGVFVSGTANEGLDAYDLPIEIGGDGRGLPATLSYAGVVAVDSFTGTIAVTGETDLMGFVQDYERIFSDSGAQIPLSATPRHLFDILIDTTSSFDGVVPLSITSTTNTPVSPFNVVASSGTFMQPGPGLIVNSGTLTAVVPEPASGIVVVILMLAGFGTRRRSI